MPKKAIALDEQGTPTGTITFAFEDNTSQVFDISKVKDAVKLRAMFHGFSQKIGDSYAGAGKDANPLKFAKEAVKETIAQLYAGDWRATSEGGPRVTDLALALSMLSGKTIEESVAFVDTLDDDQKKVWRSKAKVKAKLAEIAAKKAAERAAKLAAKVAGAETPEGEDGEEEEIDFDVPQVEAAGETVAGSDVAEVQV
jgi:hypothetical protein